MCTKVCFGLIWHILFFGTLLIHNNYCRIVHCTDKRYRFSTAILPFCYSNFVSNNTSTIIAHSHIFVSFQNFLKNFRVCLIVAQLKNFFFNKFLASITQEKKLSKKRQNQNPWNACDNFLTTASPKERALSRFPSAPSYNDIPRQYPVTLQAITHISKLLLIGFIGICCFNKLRPLNFSIDSSMARYLHGFNIRVKRFETYSKKGRTLYHSNECIALVW